MQEFDIIIYKYNIMQNQSQDGSQNSSHSVDFSYQNQHPSESTVVLDSPLYLEEEGSQLDITVKSIINLVNQSLSKSFQKKDALFEVSISKINEKMQNSLQSELSLFDKSFGNLHLESAVDQLRDIVRKIKDQQAALRAENQQLRAKLGEASHKDQQSMSHTESLSFNQANLRTACMRYRQKYHEYKKKCIQYQQKLEKIRKIQ